MGRTVRLCPRTWHLCFRPHPQAVCFVPNQGYWVASARKQAVIARYSPKPLKAKSKAAFHFC